MQFLSAFPFSSQIYFDSLTIVLLCLLKLHDIFVCNEILDPLSLLKQ